MISIPIGKLNGLTVSIPDYDDLPESSQQGVYFYGGKQYLNDGAAPFSLTVKVDGKTVRNPDYPDTPAGNAKFERDVLDAVNGRAAKIANGTMGVRGGVDPNVVMRQQLRALGKTDAEIDAFLAATGAVVDSTPPVATKKSRAA